MDLLIDSEFKTIEEARNSGKYPIVNLDIFETVKDLKISDFTLEREQEVVESYKQHLIEILSLKDQLREEFIKGIKIQEILDTQLLEQEDSYLLGIYLYSHRESAMDYLLNSLEVYPKSIGRNTILETHKKLLEGTSSEKYTKNEYRIDNTAFVSKSGYGKTEINYFALDYKDIEEALMNLTIYYNSNLHQQYTLAKPAIIHGLVGALQLFSDGNTRLGRTLQTVSIFDLTKENLKLYPSNPVLYCSRSYKDYREQYREKLGNIAIDPTDETWNKWINFNLNRMEDQIYYTSTKLKQYSKLR